MLSIVFWEMAISHRLKMGTLHGRNLADSENDLTALE